MNTESLLRNDAFIQSVVDGLKKEPGDVKTKTFIVDVKKKVVIQIK